MGFILGLICCCCLLNGLPAIIQICLALLVIAFSAQLLHSGAMSHQGIRRITCDATASWQLIGVSGQNQAATLLDSSVVLGPFIFLHFKLSAKQINLFLVPGCLSRSSSRKLRMLLKVYRSDLLSARR